MEKQKRKIIQISTATHDGESWCYALCNDGTAWREIMNTYQEDGCKFTEHTWERLPQKIPQD